MYSTCVMRSLRYKTSLTSFSSLFSSKLCWEMNPLGPGMLITQFHCCAPTLCHICLIFPMLHFHYYLRKMTCRTERTDATDEKSVCCALHTSLFQSHHGGLLYQVPLYEAPEILAVHAEVWQLECVDGHLERELLVGTLAGHLEPRQGDDSGAGVGDPTGETLLWKEHGGGVGFEEVSRQRKCEEATLRSLEYLGHSPPASVRTACRSC